MGSKSSKKGKRLKSSKKYYEAEPVKKEIKVEPAKKIEDEVEPVGKAEGDEFIERDEEVEPAVEHEEPMPVAESGRKGFIGRVRGFKPLQRMMDSRNSYINRLGNYLAYLWQYRTVVKTSVDKEFKGRFKYTALGYGWHVLNPLSQIIIYYVIFTVIFGRDIPNYWLYISSGMFGFVFCQTCITGGSGAIVGNAKMVTKLAFARETLVITKVITNLITLSISYVLLIIIMAFSGIGPTINILYLPIIIVLMAVFSTGLAFMFSALVVYFRDLQNAIGIVMGCMMFAIPVIYLASTRSSPLMEFLWSINPLYYYVECIHNVMYWGTAPDEMFILIGSVAAMITFVVGLYVFKRLEKGFAERL
ncbi:MAG: ABC transporter permease [Thermoplasmata archaeon]|jgi:ABC-2 type transport system permease protein|nr:ABC transporter permease [Thermoplasmata archaeon]